MGSNRNVISVALGVLAPVLVFTAIAINGQSGLEALSWIAGISPRLPR